MKNRLKKVANAIDLGAMNMPFMVLKQKLEETGEEKIIEENNIISRELLNDTTNFVVELWKLTGEEYVVFYGKYPEGNWISSNIECETGFNNQNDAEIFIRSNLQQYAETTIANLKRNRLKKLANANSKIVEVDQRKENYQISVYVTLENGENMRVFSYYPDEINFSNKELEGLTVDEARQLFVKKDTDYLRS